MPKLATSAAAPIRIQLRLPAALWNQPLADALANVPGLQVIDPDAPGAALSAHILITAVPSQRHGWAQLRHWCEREGLRVLVIGENRPALAAQALRLGACGYVGWDSPLPLLVKAIRVVHGGELWAERKVALALAHPGSTAVASPLTPRELHVLEALTQGKRNKEIAVQLAISETTVKSHLNRVYQKLNVSDRLGAALYVERHGLEPQLAIAAATREES